MQLNFFIFLFTQVQTDSTFEKQLHEATRQLVLDARRENQQLKPYHRDAQTSPIRAIAEPSTSIESTTRVDRTTTTTVDDSLLARDQSVAGEMPRDHDQSSRSAFETPTKRARTKTKSPALREWKSMRLRVSSLTQQVSVLKTAKETLAKSLSERTLSNEKLQNDLNQFQQRAKISKQTIEVERKSGRCCVLLY